MKLVTLSSEELELSYILARACAYAYEKIEPNTSCQIEKETGIYKVEQFQFQPNKWYGISGILGYFKDYLVIAFKGSDSKDDWMKNFRLLHDDKLLSWKKQSPSSGRINGRVHSGFHTAVNSNLSNLKCLVKKKHSQEFRKIILTGHSLGGAIAILTAAAFSKDDDFCCKKIVYTYGSPRVGDTKFRVYFDASKDINHYRFEYGYDSVPHLPLARPFNYIGKILEAGFLVPEYQHTGQIRYLMKDQQGNPIVVKDPPEFPKFLKRMLVHTANILNIDKHLQKEHHIDTYISHINNLNCLKNYQNTPEKNMLKTIAILTIIKGLKSAGKDFLEPAWKTPLLTYRETIEYYTEYLPKYPLVSGGVILRRKIYLSNNIEIYEIYQVFLDYNNDLICDPKNGIIHGRVLLVKMLDEELTERFGNTDMIVFR